MRRWCRARRGRRRRSTSAASPTPSPSGGTNPQRRTSGAWSGPKAKFLLSGLITCGRCGSRYEGITQRVQTKDAEGNPNKSYFYACGGAIRRGRTVYSFGQIPQDTIEKAVVDAILEHYTPYVGSRGLERVNTAIRRAGGKERAKAVQQKSQCEERLSEVDCMIRNLLDNLTATNRTFADVRIAELAREKERLDAKLVEVSRMVRSDAELRLEAINTHDFLSGLPEVLASHDPFAIRVAVQRCIRSVELVPNGDAANVNFQALPSDVAQPIAINCI